MSGSAFLQAYLLRPEIALWPAVDCLALDGNDFEGPEFDFGCGDGWFSFLRGGGPRNGIKCDWFDCVMLLLEALCTMDRPTDSEFPLAFHPLVLTPYMTTDT